MSKYGNKKVVIDGIKFDSIKESKRYCVLKLMEKAGEIRDLTLQPRFELQPAFHTFLLKDGVRKKVKKRKIEYVSDFQYYSVKYEGVVTEDVKGFETTIFKMKEKMLLFKYPDIMFLKT